VERVAINFKFGNFAKDKPAGKFLADRAVRPALCRDELLHLARDFSPGAAKDFTQRPSCLHFRRLGCGQLFVPVDSYCDSGKRSGRRRNAYFGARR